MVRLKGTLARRPAVLPTAVSIPYGSIKSVNGNFASSVFGK